MKGFFWALIATACFVLPVQAKDQGRQFQNIRVLGFELINNVLAFYNSNSEGMDYRFQQRYQDAQARLNELVPVQGDMRSALESIVEQLADLDAKATETPDYLYSHWINPILRSHAKLDRLASERYEKAGLSAASEHMQNELNLNLCRLSLLYQTRTFGTLGVFVMDMDEDTFTRLDGLFVNGLERLKKLHPEALGALDKLGTQYAFVRPRLMEHGEKWVPGISAYYMGNISRDLAELALN